ncbi:Hep/Hag repeat protein, partial [Fusobacterium equinum]
NMLEEKSVKHWLKRKVKVTEALLVAFLITGGIASAEETVSKAEFDALSKKVEALEKNGTNYVTILSTSEENKVAPSEGSDVVNIGTNQIGEKNKEQYYVTVVGTSNKIKNFRITPDDVKPDSIEESHAYGETVFGNGNTVADGVIIGRENIATGYSGVVLGENSKNYGHRSINIGTFTKTYGTDSIAMGFSSKALGTGALALGGYTQAKTVGAIAIGDGAIAEKGVALGYESLADRSGGEVGYYPEFGTTEREAIAKKLGKEAEYKETMKVFETSKELIEKEREYYSVIAKREEYQKQLNEQTVDLIKYNKDAQEYKDAFAKILEIKTQYKENEKKELELGKIVSTANPEYKKLEDARSTYGNIFGAYSSTMSAVSVGNEKKGIYRQITGVAAGSKDTDAVNVAQLKSLNTKVDKGATHYYSVNDIDDHVDNYKNDGAKGFYSTVAGPGSTIKQTNNQMFQGATSAILGSFNTIDAGDKEFDGVANSIVGVANTTKDANGSLIFGAGNKITNSYRGVDFAKLNVNGDSQSLAEDLRKAVANSGGSVLAIGGANTADYATLSKVIGVGNTLKGSAQNESTLNMIDGFKNTGTNIKNTTIVGSENTVENGSSNILIGDKHKLTQVSNSVILGSTEQETETTVSDVVSIGHNAKVEKKGGIALGSSSVANREKGQAGFDISTNLVSTDKSAIWKATHSAVSIGDFKKGYTRQITGVAAGSEDTDAVNVAQLKKVKDSINTAVENSKIHYYSVNSNKVGDDSNYKNNGATGDDAIAIGIGVKAKGQHAIAMGNNVESSGYASIAIGKDSEATKQGAIAIGMGAKVYAGGGVAIGTNVQAGDSPSDGDWSPVALGYGTKSLGGASTAFGYESVARGAHSIAGGDRSKATGQDSVALGQEVEASGTWSVALGQKTVASGSNSMSMGDNTKASGSNSTAMGIKTEAGGAGSTAMGYGTKAIGNWSLATGAYSKSEGKFSTAMGLSSVAKGHNSFAVSGANVEKDASNAIAMGYNATAKLTDSVALGSGSVASTKQGVAGYNPITDKNYERTPEAAAAYQKWIDAYNAWEAIDEAEKDKKAEKLKECNAMKEEYNKLVSTWESTKSAIAVGDKEKGISRQITGVAAGREDTDAVNVAQLKSVLSHPFHVFSGGKDISKGTNFTFYQMNWDFRDGLKATVEGEGENRKVVVSLDKESLKNDPDFKGPKGDKGDTGAKGDKGDTGEVGPKGDKGDTG